MKIEISWIKSRCLFTTLLFLFAGCNENVTNNTTFNFPNASKHNINENQLISAYEKAEHLSDIKSLLVARDLEIVSEVYFNGGSSIPDSTLDVRSVTKSFASILIGIAIDKGYINNVNDKISVYLGRILDENEDLANVTIHQLLTMTCGHEWAEIGEPSEFPAFFNSPDQLNYIIRKPIVNTPGTVFDYSDGAAHLVSVVITEATGMSADEFARIHLFEPLGLSKRVWYKDNRGYNYGGVGLCAAGRDLIALGNLYLQDGEWNGKQVVSTSWIDSSISPKISTNNILPYFANYGYFWWIGNAQGYNILCAIGYGGQFILVVEDLDLVVSATCQFHGINSSEAENNWNTILNIIVTDILPAVNP